MQLYTNAMIFTADPHRPDAEAFAVRDGAFLAVGTEAEVRAALRDAHGTDPELTEVDLGGAFVAPGFIDSHTHLAMFGESLGKVQLRDCGSLTEIQERLAAARAARPEAERLLGVGWLFDAVGTARPTKEMLDAVVSDIPVYLDANDLHSTWANSAALAEMGIGAETPDPIGGEIARNPDGTATGMLYETAATQYAWASLRERARPEDTIRHLETAFAAYLADGVTGGTEMALDAKAARGLRAIIARDGRLPFPITAHWLVEPSGDTATDLAVVEEVIALRNELAASGEATWFRIAGMKFIMDGTIDACTAAMRDPYANGENADPIWSADAAKPVAAAADAAGLQLALHAIGDRASEIALDVIEHCIEENVARPRRHRLEHLESVTEATIERMAKLGVIASMQPVHCDPAVLDNWKSMLGDERQERGFPWHWLRKHGVAFTLGTDAPTAPHHPLPNLYIALTAKSALNPSLDAYHPERVFTPEQALTAFTRGAAYAGETDQNVGQIAVGMQANFSVFGVNPMTDDPTQLLTGAVRSTHVLGEPAYVAS